MATSVDRADRLIEKLDAAWNDFRDAYAGLSDEELLEHGVVGDWSVRDLIAHVTWWEEEALSHLPTILAGGRPMRYSVAYGGIDAFNARRTEQRRELSLDEVREACAATHRRLVAFLREVPPEELRGDSRFRRRLRLDTYGHSPIPAADIRAWREQRDVQG
jgi:hypothetical protein